MTQQSKRPTRNDVANLAKVSGWTVSKVINGCMDSRIADETRERVLDAANELGYRPNLTARALATGTTHVIAICADIRSPYSFKVISKFQPLFTQHGYRMLIIDLNQALISPQLSLGPVDGFISLDSNQSIERFIEGNGNLQIPFVSIGVYYIENRDHITIDIYDSSIKALEHLYDSGCRRIAYIQPGFAEPITNDPRLHAYNKFMKEHLLTPVIIDIPGDTREKTLELIREYIPVHGCPDAIFCHNDHKAIAVYRALREMGYKIPDDLLLIGCDGIEETEYLDSKLSTIVQPVDEMCRISWEFLHNRMRNQSIPAQTAVLQSTLEIRESAIRP
ncbi:MAG: LacI family DNA-binding transcriptional regulator [Armatimonadota bacterium]